MHLIEKQWTSDRTTIVYFAIADLEAIEEDI